jgi:hypothetical protein
MQLCNGWLAGIQQAFTGGTTLDRWWVLTFPVEAASNDDLRRALACFHRSLRYHAKPFYDTYRFIST